MLMLLSCLVMLPKPTNAVTVTTGCGEVSSEFGLSCSLNELLSGGSLNVDGILFNNWRLEVMEPFGRRLNPADLRVVPYTSHNLFGFLMQDMGDTLRVEGQPSLEYVSENIFFRVTDQQPPHLFGGFDALTLGVSYGEIQEGVAPPQYFSVSASVRAEVEGDKGTGDIILQCTPGISIFPCASPDAATEFIDYPVMMEPKLDHVLETTLWVRVFAWPQAVAEIDQVLFGVHTLPTPGTLILLGVGLIMLRIRRGEVATTV